MYVYTVELVKFLKKSTKPNHKSYVHWKSGNDRVRVIKQIKRIDVFLLRIFIFQHKYTKTIKKQKKSTGNLVQNSFFRYRPSNQAEGTVHGILTCPVFGRLTFAVQ